MTSTVRPSRPQPPAAFKHHPGTDVRDRRQPPTPAASTTVSPTGGPSTQGSSTPPLSSAPVSSAVPALRVEGAWKSFADVAALAGVDLDVAEGSLVAVLGPSGCGKTTLLRCLAGFERLDSGRIQLRGRTVSANGTHLPPHRRRIAVVPQEGALFPHLSVAGNVGYGLDRSGRRSGRVDEVLAMVGLDGYQRRMPHELSGGQQQRVAVARALAPRPALVLLDEPFTALDASLRHSLRRDVREALRSAGTSAIWVTHDQDEALSTADVVAVMRAGHIVQVGPPARLYETPADPWTASFLGEAVLLPGTACGGHAHTALGVNPLIRPAGADSAEAAEAAVVTVLVRPEQVELLARDAGGAAATVVDRTFHGHDSLVTLALAGSQSHDETLVVSRVPGDGAALAVPGTPVSVRARGPVHAWRPA